MISRERPRDRRAGHTESGGESRVGFCGGGGQDGPLQAVMGCPQMESRGRAVCCRWQAQPKRDPGCEQASAVCGAHWVSSSHWSMGPQRVTRWKGPSAGASLQEEGLRCKAEWLVLVLTSAPCLAGVSSPDQEGNPWPRPTPWCQKHEKSPAVTW